MYKTSNKSSSTRKIKAKLIDNDENDNINMPRIYRIRERERTSLLK